MKLVFRFLMVISITAFLSSCQPKEEGFVKQIDKESLKEMAIGRDVQLIDVRSPKEYLDGHIDDALSINVNNDVRFQKEIAKLDKNEPVYIYCKLGGRSAKAATLLKEAGFKKIYDYSGGYDDWISY